jgi:FkbM family methyltransferase
MQRVFISYSANREDVFLDRIFGLKDKGFYVDVGAAHPTFENDTKSLYDRGWRGINIEPNETFFNELVKERSEDINLNMAISDQSGPLAYFEVLGTGLSTCDSEEAKRALSRGHKISSSSVKTTTLREVFSAHSISNVDVLKVDVEGLEFRVLQSNDWDVIRPSIVIVEATFPETPVRRPDEITPYMQQRNYRRAYFDGLNDYFVANEFSLAAGVFELPPNIFDGFLPYKEKMLADSFEYKKALSDRLASDLQSSREEIIILSAKVASQSAQQHKLQDCLAQLARLQSELLQARNRNSALAQKLAETATQIDQVADGSQVKSADPSKPRPRGMKKIIKALKRPRHTIRELLSKR